VPAGQPARPDAAQTLHGMIGRVMMAIDLTKPAKQVNFDTDTGYKPMLERLQANILASHGRNHGRHLFIRFTGAPAAVKAWIKTKVAPNVTTAAQQRQQSKDRAAAKTAGKTFDGGLVTGFFLSAAGYRAIGLDPTKLSSKGFRKGMKDRKNFEGPDLILGINLSLKNRDPEPAKWEAGFQGEIHALLTLADDDLARLRARVDAAKAELAAGIGTVSHVQDGRVLRRPIPGSPGRFEPIEHFGYFDGLSQPIFTKPDLDDYDKDQGGPAKPGDWDPGASLGLVLADDPFTADADAFGSYLVYRKLEQDYDMFAARVKALAADVPISEELAGAYVVGRFKDGTPTSVRDTPSPGLETDNRFVHSTDKKGLKCPMHAHIRKANPRGTTPATSPADESARRVTRRGIPYGKPHPDLGCDPVEYEIDKAGPRGLVFMCFQANVEEHFEFIQRVWIDNNEFPKGTIPLIEGNTGDDPLIGQDLDEKQRWPKKWNNQAAGTKKFNFEAAVTLKGGEYFFAPSLPFLASL
jgi:Dyp-type peroxidase family